MQVRSSRLLKYATLCIDGVAGRGNNGGGILGFEARERKPAERLSESLQEEAQKK